MKMRASSRKCLATQTGTLPWFKFYVSAFGASTHWLSEAEVGAYLRLLVLAWETSGCSLTVYAKWINRHLSIRSEAEFGPCENVLSEFWRVEQGRYFNECLAADWRLVSQGKARDESYEC